MAAGCGDGAIALWGAGGELVASLGDGEGFGGVLSLALLPDGQLAAGYGTRGDTSVRLWDVRRRVLDAVLTGHALSVYALAVLPDGRVLSGGGDELKVWDERALYVRGGEATAECAATLQVPVGVSIVFALAVLRDGSVASAHHDGHLLVWG